MAFVAASLATLFAGRLAQQKPQPSDKYELQTLEDLFLHELKDLYSAENQLVKALPKMAKAATNPNLRLQLCLRPRQEHARQTLGRRPRPGAVRLLPSRALASHAGKQILLINLLTDFPEMTIAGDNVDPELVETPRRWTRLYTALYDRFRPSARHSTFSPCSAGAAKRDNGRNPHRVVHRVDCLRRAHRAGCAKPQALLPEPSQWAAYLR